MATKDDVDTAIERFARLVLMGTSMSKMACESKEAVWIADFFENIGFSSFARQLFFGDSPARECHGREEEKTLHKL